MRSGFGKGLVVCLPKFYEHFSGDFGRCRKTKGVGSKDNIINR